MSSDRVEAILNQLALEGLGDRQHRHLRTVAVGGALRRALAVLAGLVLAVITTFADDDPAPAGAGPRVAAPATDMSRQDALAAAPMPPAEPEAALPGPLATEAAGVIELPRPTGPSAAYHPRRGGRHMT